MTGDQLIADDRRLRSTAGPRRRWLLAAQGLFYVALVCAVLPFGAADRFSLDFSTLTIALTTAAAAFITIVNDGPRRLYWWAFGTILFLIAYVGFQSLQFEGNPLANPIWKVAGDELGFKFGSISVAPAEGIYALGGLASPFLTFMAALALFQGDDGAKRLWRFLAVSGGLVAVFALAQFLTAPGTLLIYPKVYYLDSLTAVFVNRNTAATYFGITALLLLGMIVEALRGRRGGDLFETLLTPRWEDRGVRLRLFFYGGLLVAALLALFLTKSRGGVASTLLAFLVASVLLAVFSKKSVNRPGKATAAGQPSNPWRRPLSLFAIVAAIFGVVLIFGGQALLRMQVGGADDARFCILPGFLAAIRDNWIWGSGFATFDQVFPAYRDPACGIDGSWLRAHDSFLEGYLGFGLVFVPVVLFIYGALIATLVHGLRHRRRLRYAPIVGLAVLVLVTAHSIVDFSMQIQGVRVVFAAAMAVAVTFSFRGRRPLQEELALRKPSPATPTKRDNEFGKM